MTDRRPTHSPRSSGKGEAGRHSGAGYEADDESVPSPMIVKKVPTKKSQLPQTRYMEANIINRYPSMLLMVGKSGSGKSTICTHLCVTPEFFGGGFFHHVYLFSPTAKADDLVEVLKLPDDHIITEPTDAKLNELLDQQDALIADRGIEWTGKNSRMLLIFDDIISKQDFLKGPGMMRLAAMGRHSLASSIVLSQSYTRVPRPVRLQANGIILLPSAQSEVKLLTDEYCPPHVSKRDFAQLVEMATKGRHDFLFINNMEPDPDLRFRHGFGVALTIMPTGGYTDSSDGTPRTQAKGRGAVRRPRPIRRDGSGRGTETEAGSTRSGGSGLRP